MNQPRPRIDFLPNNEGFTVKMNTFPLQELLSDFLMLHDPEKTLRVRLSEEDCSFSVDIEGGYPDETG